MQRNNGFTLVELLVTMTIVVLLLAAATPGFKVLMKNNRVTDETAKLVHAMQLARSEAMKRETGMVICASTDQATCSGSGNWASGWIVFTDPDQDADLDGTGSCLPEAGQLTGDCIVRDHGKLNDVTLTGSAFKVRFFPDGQAIPDEEADPQPPVFFILRATDCKRSQQRLIMVSPQGKTSVMKQACS